MKKTLFYLLSAGLLLGISYIPAKGYGPGKPMGSSTAKTALYIVTSKETYAPGETLAFQVFIFNQPATGNRSVFVELLDCKGRPVAAKMLAADAGSSAGQFEMPNNGENAYYFLYCYVLNNKNGVEADELRKITVGNSTATGASSKRLNLSVYPEGNSFVAGCPNNLLAKCTDADGMPVMVPGQLVNEKNEVFSYFKTNAAGYASLVTVPEINGNYTLEATGSDGIVTRQVLPKPAASGVTLRVTESDSSLQYSVFSYTDKDEELDYTIAAMIDADTVYTAGLNFQKGLSVVREEVLLSKLPPGFITLKLIGQSGKIYTERIFYNQPVSKNANFVRLIDTIARREMKLDLPAYANGKACLKMIAQPKDSAANGWLLRAAGKGDDKIFITEDDALSFNDGLIEQQPAPVLSGTAKDTANRFLSLTGILYDAEKKILKNKKLTLVVIQRNQKNFLEASSDKQGVVKINNLVFFDSATVYYQLADKSAEKNSISLELAVSPAMPHAARLLAADRFTCLSTQSSTPPKEIVTKNNDSGRAKTLENVLVKGAKEKTETQKFEEKNVSGQHKSSSFARGEFDFIKNPQLVDNTLLFDFIKGRIGGLLIKIQRDGTPSVVTTSGALVGVYLDDMELDMASMDMVAGLTVRDVALVRYYSMPFKPRTFTNARGRPVNANENGGDLMIYTRRGFTAADAKVKGLPKLTVTGYDPGNTGDISTTGGTASRVIYWHPGFYPQKEPVLYVRLPDNYADLEMAVVIEGVNTLSAPYRFTRRLEFK